MLLFKNNTTNTFVTTISEQNKITPLSASTYLMKLTNRLLKKEKIFNITNSSTATSRYDLFQVEFVNDLSSEDLTNAQVYIPNGEEGYWDYSIYTNSANTLSISSSTVCEVGIVKIKPTGTTVTNYNYITTATTGNNTYYFN